MDWSDVTKFLGACAAAVSAAVGLKTLIDKHRERRKAFWDQIATREQIDRHKAAGELHVEALRQELTRRLDNQDKDIREIRQDLQDMPLRIVEALKQ